MAFAKAVGTPPVEALVAAGYLEPGDAGQVVKVTSSLKDFTTDELLDEIRSRTIDGRG